MTNISIFVSFDVEHDAALHKLLVAESKASSSGFDVSNASERPSEGPDWETRLRRRIRAVDQVIVICGEHTGESESMGAELRVAVEEGKSHFLIWGRRDIMCTKPIGAKSAEGIYSWTPMILQEQITIASRRTGERVARETQRAATQKR